MKHIMESGTAYRISYKLLHPAIRNSPTSARNPCGTCSPEQIPSIPPVPERLGTATREDHAAHIANWLDVLKPDSRVIFTAASHAQRAADFINGLQSASAG